jgi:lysozyme
MTRPKVKDVESQLREDEGEKLYAYKDSEGFWTIGIGILIDQRKGGGLLPEESSFIFQNRVRILKGRLRKELPWFEELDEVRQGVLLNMAYQMGVDGLLKFKNTLASIKARQYTAASVGMLDSLWARQTPERAERLAEQMRTGVWQ